jgi:hypothetical protein
MTAHELRLSRYEPGRVYTASSTWTSMSDVGRSFDDGDLTLAEYERVEQTYLTAIGVLLAQLGNPELTVSDVQLAPAASEQAQAVREGSLVDAAAAIDICRLELREELSCRLDGDHLYVHVGIDYYVYVGCEYLDASAVAAIEASGLFVEQDVPSPYATA